jgi:hypothetical protein
LSPFPTNYYQARFAQATIQCCRVWLCRGWWKKIYTLGVSFLLCFELRPKKLGNIWYAVDEIIYVQHWENLDEFLLLKQHVFGKHLIRLGFIAVFK